MTKFATIMDGFFNKEEAVRAAEADAKIRQLLAQHRFGRRKLKAAVAPLPTADEQTAVISTFEAELKEKREKDARVGVRKGPRGNEDAVSGTIARKSDTPTGKGYRVRPKGQQGGCYSATQAQKIGDALRGRKKRRTKCKGCGKVVSYQMLGRWHKDCKS